MSAETFIAEDYSPGGMFRALGLLSVMTVLDREHDTNVALDGVLELYPWFEDKLRESPLYESTKALAVERMRKKP